MKRKKKKQKEPEDSKRLETMLVEMEKKREAKQREEDYWEWVSEQTDKE